MRRVRHKTSLGPVSSSERRNADLFFAELMGRGAPGASGPREGAELFFEELMGMEAQAPLALPPAIEDAEFAEAPADTKQPPTVTPGVDSNEIIVTRVDGTRFHVRRKVRTVAVIDPDRLRTGFCADDKRMFFRARWCKGTQGTIDVGADVPAAAKKLVTDLVNQINQVSQGGKIDTLRQTLENTPVETFLEFKVLKTGSFVITGDIKLDFNPSGFASGTGTVSAKTPWVEVGVEASVGPDGKKVLVKGTIPLGRRKIKGELCKPQELVSWWDVECLREVPTTNTLDPHLPPKVEREEVFLYFEHALIALRREPKGAAVATLSDEVDAILHSDPKSGTARLNRRTLERIPYLLRQGYYITAIEGYASPEGRRPGPQPADQGALANWEGNIALARRRAEKVKKLITSRFVTLQMRMPTAEGRSEKPILDDQSGKELEGAALDRALILGIPTRVPKLKPFLEEHPKEPSRMTAEDLQFITDRRNTSRNRAERLFENLRRVEIRLERPVPRGVTLPDYELEYVRPCPDDLIEAAERQWGSRIPFTKPDPPLCN
jgi:hypothetical protein